MRGLNDFNQHRHIRHQWFFSVSVPMRGLNDFN